MDDLRELVRGDLTKLERMVLSALIVIEVHARDVLARMLEEQVDSVNDFEWISQLRLVNCVDEIPVCFVFNNVITCINKK